MQRVPDPRGTGQLQAGPPVALLGFEAGEHGGVGDAHLLDLFEVDEARAVGQGVQGHDPQRRGVGVEDGKATMTNPPGDELTTPGVRDTLRVTACGRRWHSEGKQRVARKRLLEWAFLIPVRRDRNLSNGRPHRQATWNWLEASLAEFGGATRDTAPQEGWYLDRDSGERVPDTSRRYYVAVAPKQLARLRAVLRQACVEFHQKCIYLSVAGAVEFVRGPGYETG
jgi:hypothetical protein